MAKPEHQVTVQEQLIVSVDDNNNDNNKKCPGNATVFSNVKYQLRPRSVKSRRRSDSNWNLQDTLSQKQRPPPLSRYRRKTANARERYRMGQINSAFETLRGALPSWVCRRRAASELTKISMLRLASAYIRSLQDILDGNAHQDTCSWVLSSLSGDVQNPKQTQFVHYNPSSSSSSSNSSSSSKTQQPPANTVPDSDLMTLLSGASEPGVFQDHLESSYLPPLPDTDTFGLWLGYDPPRCWSEAQHTLPVS